MNAQTKMAIVAIMIVISLASVVVYDTNTHQEFTSNDNSKLQAISSFNPLYEFSQIVGGEKIDVILLVPVGVEPHDWEPTIKDVQQMHKSDFIIINGIGFENWVDDLIENNYQGIIVDTSNGIEQIPETTRRRTTRRRKKKNRSTHLVKSSYMQLIQVGNIALCFFKF